MLSIVGFVCFFAVLALVGADNLCVGAGYTCVAQDNFTTTPQIDSYCLPFLHGHVLVNTTQQGVNITVASAIRTLRLAPYTCAIKAIELLCQTSYPKCDPTSPIPLAELPCKVKCESTMKTCNSFLDQIEDLLHIPYLFPTTCDIWPSSYTVCNISGEQQIVPCNTEQTEETREGMNTSPDGCPYIMEKVESPSPFEAPCKVKCPLPLFHIGVWERDMKVAYTLAWLSFFCLLFMIASFLLNENKRKYPQNLFLNLFICCLIISIFILVVNLAGKEKVLCHNGNPSTQEFGPCGLQGAVIFFFALSATCWWFSIVVNLFIMVRATVQTFSHENAKYFYIFSYGFPAIMTIIALSLKAFGFYAPHIICFLPIEGSKEWIQYVVYYVPIGIMIVIGATLNCIIFYKLIQAYYTNLGKIDKRSMSPYYKIAFFTGCFIFIWLAIFVRMGVAKNGQIHDSFVTFSLCHIKYYALNQESVGFCGTEPARRPSLHLLRLQYVAITVHGIVCFFLFCHDREVYSGWRGLYKELCRRVQKRKEPTGRGGIDIKLSETTGGGTAMVIS